MKMIGQEEPLELRNVGRFTLRYSGEATRQSISYG